MPVISPRRTSSTSSGSLYIPPSTATTSSNLSSSLGKSSSPSTNATSSGYSSTYRSNSLSKPASSNYSSSFGYSGSYSTSSYLPRTSAYRSGGGGTSSYGSSALTGGSSYLSSYRPSSYLSSGNNDTAASSRFGVSRNSSCRHSRSYSDRDLPPQHSSPRRRSSFSKTLTSISNKNNNNNSSTDYYDTLTRKYSTTHTTATTRPSSPSKISANESASSDLKPPIYGGRSRSSSLRYVTNLLPNNSGTKQQLRDEHNGDDNVDYNCNYNSLKSSSSSLSFFSATKSDSNATSCNNHKINNNNCCNCLDSVNNLNDINDDNSFQSKPTITTTTTTNVSSTSGSNINSTITNAITTTDTIATATATNHSPNPHHHHHHQLQKKLEYSKDDHDGTKMSTNKSNSNSNSTFSRLSGSYSSSSLARLVATSGLDLYEKYSPAHYIPKCELSRSRSVSEATTSVSKNAVHTAANGSSSGSNENYSQAGRHSQNGLRDNNNHDDSEPHLNNISNITSRRNGLSHHTRSVADNADDDDDDVVNGSGGGRNDITTRNHLRDLKISSYSTIDNDTATASEQDAAATTTSSSKLETQFANNKQKRNNIVVVQAKTVTNSTESAKPKNNKSAANTGNQQFYLISAFKDQNFLKTECELARAQVIRSRPRKKLAAFNVLEDEDKIANSLLKNNEYNDDDDGDGDDVVNGGDFLGNENADDDDDSDDSDDDNNNKCNVKQPAKGGSHNLNRSNNGHMQSSSSLDIKIGGRVVEEGGRGREASRVTSRGDVVVGNRTQTDNVVTKVTKLTQKLTSSASGLNSGKSGLNLNSATSKFNPIKPLIHRSSASNNKYLTKFLSNTSIRSSPNNNMHCLQNNSELLDDIKYIDSDDTGTSDRNQSQSQLNLRHNHHHHHHQHHQQHQPHQHHHHHYHNQQEQSSEQRPLLPQHKVKLRPKSSIISSSNQDLFEKVSNYKYVNGTIASGSNRKSSSTLPLTGVMRRDFISGIDSSSIRASIEKFNTLSEMKRLPSVTATATLGTANSNSASNLQHYQHTQRYISNSNNTYDYDNNISNNKFSSTGGGGSGGNTLTRSLNRNTVAASVVANKVIANFYSSPSPSTTGSNSCASSNGGSTASMCSGASSVNNYCSTKSGSNRSTEPSPSHSPQTLRQLQQQKSSSSNSPLRESLANANVTAAAANVTSAIPNLSKNVISSLVNSSSCSVGNHEKATITTSNPILATSTTSSSNPSSSTVAAKVGTSATPPSTSPSSSSNVGSGSTDKKLSNKLCDINESVRNASIRSALPPPSPTPSRYWDRDSGSSRSLLLSSSRNLSSDGKSSSSALSNSSLDEKPQTEGLCGLRNIGNTCFMNSIIQCLSHTSELTKFLKTQTGIRSASSKDQQILYEFAKLIREMWTSNVHSVTPMELKRAFSSKHRMYSDYNQQDAQEFLRFFLDSLHSALNSGVKGEHLKLDDSMSDNKKADLTWDWYTKHENSLIRDLFVGQLKSTLRCTTCGNTSVTFDPFWDLSVPLPSSTRCKLDACLDFFIREEILDGDEMPTCSKCQTRRKCTKSFRIQRFPKYLAIHLKRFSETRWSKMSNIVEFPTGERELNMGPYGSNSSTNAYYSLYAISNHMGSTAGGHYVALCKHPVARKWHEFNDNIVSDDLSESHLVSSSAYILFYERA